MQHAMTARAYKMIRSKLLQARVLTVPAPTRVETCLVHAKQAKANAS